MILYCIFKKREVKPNSTHITIVAQVCRRCSSDGKYRRTRPYCGLRWVWARHRRPRSHQCSHLGGLEALTHLCFWNLLGPQMNFLGGTFHWEILSPWPAQHQGKSFLPPHLCSVFSLILPVLGDKVNVEKDSQSLYYLCVQQLTVGLHFPHVHPTSPSFSPP